MKNYVSNKYVEFYFVLQPSNQEWKYFILWVEWKSECRSESEIPPQNLLENIIRI